MPSHVKQHEVDLLMTYNIQTGLCYSGPGSNAIEEIHHTRMISKTAALRQDTV